MGRQVIGLRMGTNLSDVVYVELSIRQLEEPETMDLVKVIMQKDKAVGRDRPIGGGAIRPEMTPSRALAQLRRTKWDAFRQLIKTSIAAHGEYKHNGAKVANEERVFTYAQATQLAPPRKRRRANTDGPKGDGKPEGWIECWKCKKAGITKIDTQIRSWLLG